MGLWGRRSSLVRNTCCWTSRWRCRARRCLRRCSPRGWGFGRGRTRGRGGIRASASFRARGLGLFWPGVDRDLRRLFWGTGDTFSYNAWGLRISFFPAQRSPPLFLFILCLPSLYPAGIWTKTLRFNRFRSHRLTWFATDPDWYRRALWCRDPWFFRRQWRCHVIGTAHRGGSLKLPQELQFLHCGSILALVRRKRQTWWWLGFHSFLVCRRLRGSLEPSSRESFSSVLNIFGSGRRSILKKFAPRPCLWCLSGHYSTAFEPLLFKEQEDWKCLDLIFTCF